MAQIDVSKEVGFIVTGKGAVIQVAKVVGYAILVPGSDGGSTAVHQGTVHGQITWKLSR